jgi:competence protein ComEC
LVAFATGFGAGIWAVGAAPQGTAIMLALTGILALAIQIGRRRWWGNVTGSLLPGVTLLLFCLAGMVRMETVNWTSAGSVREYAGRNVTIHGTIREMLQPVGGNPGEWKIRVDVDTDGVMTGRNDNGLRPVQGGLRLTVTQKEQTFSGKAGDSITAAGVIRLFHSYHNPGQIDFETTLAIRGLDARMSVAPGNLRVVGKDAPETLATRLARWRLQVRAELRKAMPDTDAALIQGMLFGGYDGIERQTVRDFAATGIVHILSVSGAHIALVAGAVFWLTRRFFIGEIASAAVAGTAMIGYGLISGFSAPVVRSVIMGLIAMAAIGLCRRESASRALTLAVFGMLSYEPRYLFDISFQLSIACTGGLLYLHPPLETWLGKIKTKKKWQKFFLSGFALTLAVQLAVLPLQAWYFGLLPWISFFANLFVVPLLEAVILLGLFGVILAGGMESLTQPFFAGISLLTGLAVEMNRFFARLPGNTIPLPAFGLSYSILYYGLLSWLFGYWTICGHSPATCWRTMSRRPKESVFLGLAASLALLFMWQRPGPLQVHFIDVGQGDATLVITPHGRSVLIDAGGAMGPQNTFDVGERVVVPYLRHYGVQQVDWLILTHNHQDHAGGAAAVAEFLGVRQALLHLSATDEPPAILRLRRVMRNRGMREATDIGEIRLDGIRVQLYQVGDSMVGISGKSANRKQESENSRSTVARIEFGRHSFLVTGDLEGEGETRISRSNIHHSTMLKVGHHGGRKSTQAVFLAKVSPQFAVISVGADNRYGHPAPETLRRLREWPVSLWRTDRDGAVVFRSDGEKLTVERTLH